MTSDSIEHHEDKTFLYMLYGILALSAVGLTSEVSSDFNRKAMNDELLRQLPEQFSQCVESADRHCAETVPLNSVSGFLPWVETGPLTASHDFKQSVQFEIAQTEAGSKETAELCTRSTISFIRENGWRYPFNGTDDTSCEPITLHQAYEILERGL